MTMRAYFWGNMYLSAIQQGIQALHCTSEMYCKYSALDGDCEGVRNADLFNWGRNEKTVVILNAGESISLHKIRDKFDTMDHTYAWAYWSESEDAINGALTSVGIILPEKVYVGAREIKKNWRDPNRAKKLGFTEFETYLAELINSTYMAR